MREMIRVALTTVVVSGAVATASPAHATPGHGVTTREVWHWTVDDTAYTLREITIGPGGATGWHHHPGLVFATIRSGTLTHVLADCEINRYRTGDSLMEDPDDPRSHTGENRGSTPLVMDVVYATPAGKPLSTDAPAADC
ncbi:MULTISPECIES: cupin domain-containing protein [Actinoplanes]|uniref:cupin domain-containing protein n=1 Tax=Actinoplanes TaxID=1865 RepID=UPI0005F2AB4F|nr:MULTISPECIES: cupin domain-containing protein [Actinoplanes]GLY07334.1 cupin [Actinoplanes sp. NBRC 101535]